MVKGMAELVNSLILEHKGSFESKRACDMDGFGVYGKTWCYVKKKYKLNMNFCNSSAGGGVTTPNPAKK